MNYLTKAQRIAYIPDCLYYYCLNKKFVNACIQKDEMTKSQQYKQKLILKANALNWEIGEKQRIMRLFIGYSRSAMIDLCHSDISFRKAKVTSFDMFE